MHRNEKKCIGSSRSRGSIEGVRLLNLQGLDIKNSQEPPPQPQPALANPVGRLCVSDPSSVVVCSADGRRAVARVPRPPMKQVAMWVRASSTLLWPHSLWAHQLCEQAQTTGEEWVLQEASARAPRVELVVEGAVMGHSMQVVRELSRTREPVNVDEAVRRGDRLVVFRMGAHHYRHHPVPAPPTTPGALNSLLSRGWDYMIGNKRKIKWNK